MDSGMYTVGAKGGLLSVEEKARRLRRAIDLMLPDGREKSLARTKLDECVMWARAAFDGVQDGD